MLFLPLYNKGTQPARTQWLTLSEGVPLLTRGSGLCGDRPAGQDTGPAGRPCSWVSSDTAVAESPSVSP